MVCDSALRIVISAYFCGTVTRAYHGLATGGYVIEIFLVFFVVNERAQARESSFFVFRLISCFSTFDEYFLNHPCIRVLPVITQTNTGFDFIYILSSGTTGTESIPFDFTFMNLYVKLLRFRKHRHCCCGSVYASLCLSGRYPLHTMHTAFIFHGSVNIRPGQVEHNLFVSAGSTFGY